MSSNVWSSRITIRAKCKRLNCPKGMSALSGSRSPGARFIEASNWRSSASRDGVIAARIMKLDCGVIAAYSKTSSPVGS